MFEVTRTDTRVTWWTGSRLFLGTAPSPRLLAWPELRRVHTDEYTHTLSELPSLTYGPRPGRFRDVLLGVLEKVPLTDLATCARGGPPFEWNGANLGLFATPHGRVLALRALALGPARSVDATLARATYAHVKAGAWENVARMADVMAERALALATAEVAPPALGPEPDPSVEADARYAQAFGAVVALSRTSALAGPLESTRRLTARLMPLVQSTAGREVAAILAGPGAGHFLAMAAVLEKTAAR
jgi:hypothetical protein